ncbi:MAG: toll/interleukin-1 receptor domain-containing protein, partial [Gammaproteobacteria bacterium]
MVDIFLSYESGDRQRIQPVVAGLHAEGWALFWDRKIPAGQTWRQYIGRALEKARCIVVAWSKTSIQSEWVIE